MKTRKNRKSVPVCLGWAPIARNDAWPVFLSPEPLVNKAGQFIGSRIDYAACTILVASTVPADQYARAVAAAVGAIRSHFSREK